MAWWQTLLFAVLVAVSCFGLFMGGATVIFVAVDVLDAALGGEPLLATAGRAARRGALVGCGVFLCYVGWVGAEVTRRRRWRARSHSGQR